MTTSSDLASLFMSRLFSFKTIHCLLFLSHKCILQTFLLVPCRMARVSKPVPPPPPPPQRTVVSTSQTYKLNTVPFSLLKKVVQSFSVDFLKAGSHVIFRANFKHPIARDTKSAPKGTTGLVLDQGMSSGQDIECSLMLKTIKYDGPHRQALKTDDLPLAGKKTVRDFVNLIRKAHLVPFWPFFNGSENVGCRDWGYVVRNMSFRAEC